MGFGCNAEKAGGNLAVSSTLVKVGLNWSERSVSGTSVAEFVQVWELLICLSLFLELGGMKQLLFAVL